MMDWFFSPYLIWTVVGLLLLITELTTLNFILCFFGLGALIVALLTWLGLTASLSSQLLVFTLSSLFLLFVLRRTARKLFAGHADAPPDYAGQKVTVVKTIPAGGEGTIAYRGSEWIAFSDAPGSIPEGAAVIIETIEGIRVKVKPVE
ncbi:MAG: NfeD family protein [Smithellaceae bacterium]|nr:NfeD family protein [Syntrophaceae bacterium]MDD4239814.1 NfeD family protein [Smithellaceae bacterium]NLX52912.1 NfeD family protein [Deltaproteobacteria bacterium]